MGGFRSLACIRVFDFFFYFSSFSLVSGCHFTLCLVVFCPFIWFRVVLGRPDRFRMFGVALGCLESIQIFNCVLLFELVILLFVVFIRCRDVFLMMCSALLQSDLRLFLEVVECGLRCFCVVFGSFNFLWIGFGFRGCFRLLKVVSSFQLCEVCFTLLFFCGWLWVVLGCCR